MNRQEVCEHPDLQNLTFKIELNERGQIIMTPVKVSYSLYQGEVGYLLRSMLKKGKTLVECAISTRKGTKVADVARISPERLERIRHEAECSVAPEICFELLSDSNTESEMQGKRQLCFEAGAEEVWTCSEEGNMSFYNIGGKLGESALAPGFPEKVEI